MIKKINLKIIEKFILKKEEKKFSLKVADKQLQIPTQP